MRKKLKSKEGFTLAELLIVVAIIAILAMISIPIFTSRMENAKKNTDLANERSAKAAAVSAYLDESLTAAQTYYYDVENGAVDKDKTKIACDGYNQAKHGSIEPKTAIIRIDIGADGSSITASWEAKN